MVTTTPVKCCQEVFGPENKYSCVLAVACMRTSETATNLPVLTDRELIRIILHQKKNVITVTEKKKKPSLFMFLFVLRVCWVV